MEVPGINRAEPIGGFHASNRGDGGRRCDKSGAKNGAYMYMSGRKG